MEENKDKALKNSPEVTDEEIVRKTFSTRDLTIVEHMFIASSDNINGASWDSYKVMKYLREEKDMDVLRRMLLTPLSLLSEEKKINEVNKARSQRGIFAGYCAIFDLDQQVSSRNQQSKPYFKLGHLDEKGQIKGEWEVGLVVNNERNKIDSSSLKLNSEFSKYLTLETDSSRGGKILRLKL
jgi:hypothetical protein